MDSFLRTFVSDTGFSLPPNRPIAEKTVYQITLYVIRKASVNRGAGGGQRRKDDENRRFGRRPPGDSAQPFRMIVSRTISDGWNRLPPGLKAIYDSRGDTARNRFLPQLSRQTDALPFGDDAAKRGLPAAGRHKRSEIRPSQQMVVKMEDDLPRVFSAVVDQTIPGFRQSQLLRRAHGRLVQFRQQRPIAFAHIVHGRDVFFGNEQQMHRRLRLNVVKAQHMFILVHDIGRQFAGDDFAENAIHACSPPSP